MSTKLNPYDNANIDHFYKTLRGALINDPNFQPRPTTLQKKFNNMTTYSITKRIIPVLDNKTPKAFEKNNF